MIRATFAGFTTALSALEANQKRLDVIGNNLANMNTEGYTRQQLEVSSLNYSNPTDYYMNHSEVNVGFGAAMNTVSQLRDQFLDVQYREQNGKTEYNKTIESSLDSLAQYLDETKLDGIRTSFDNIQTALTNMQDPAKVNDPVYEGELRSRMSATATLFNNVASQISTAKTDELSNITGKGTSENGAVEKVNTLLKEIGELNSSIYRNQLVGNQVLELQDERNLKIDELSSYIPVKVSYYNTDTSGASSVSGTKKTYHPDDMQLETSFTTFDKTGKSQTTFLTLVKGHDLFNGKNNYGSVKAVNPDDSKADPTVDSIELVFTVPDEMPDAIGETSVTTNTAAPSDSAATVRLSSGSAQASLDMLAGAADSLNNGTIYRSYDYYMSRLDTLAKTWATQMNALNKMGVTGDYSKKSSVSDGTRTMDDIAVDLSDGGASPYLLLVNRTDSSAQGITAANVSVSSKWVAGVTHIGTSGDPAEGNSASDTVLNMLQYMLEPQKALSNKSYADEMNNISTYLANDSYNNDNALTTNKAVLGSISTSKDQLSGVSLDEEAANMMTYVSSYNAAARLMSTLDSTLETLLGIGA